MGETGGKGGGSIDRLGLGIVRIDNSVVMAMISGIKEKRLGGVGTHSVAYGELLLGTDDGAAALGSIQGALAADDGLALGTAAANLASNLDSWLPVRHFDGCCFGDVVCGCWVLDLGG